MSEAIIEKDIWNAMSELAQRGIVSKHKVNIKTDLFSENGKPKCAVCGKEMKKSVDSKTGQISQFIWELNCECVKNEKLKGLRLSLG
jgi:hypothetical protein